MFYMIKTNSNTHCTMFFSHTFRMNGNEGPSGFGFELTFRLKREQGETNPPTWPATLMQALSRYVFQTGIKCSVDV